MNRRGEALSWAALQFAGIVALGFIVGGPSWWMLAPAVMLGVALAQALEPTR